MMKKTERDREYIKFGTASDTMNTSISDTLR